MASTILELAASMVRIFDQMRLRCLLIAVAAAFFAAEAARADLLVYRCGNDVCRVAPDGTGKRKLTREGTHTWLSASADGSRLAVVRDTFAFVLDGRGRQLAGGSLERGGTVVIAEISPDGSQVATIELLPEITPAPVGSPPGSPGIPGFQPYLFLNGANRDVVARAVADTAWFGARLTRTDPGSSPPFPLGVCLLAVNTDFPCERDVARDPALDVYGAAFSPDGTQVAVAREDGAIVVDGTQVLTGGQPSWSPDGRRIAFERDGDLYVGQRRILRGGKQPVWTSAPACKARPRLRVRRKRVIVTACAPQPGRVTITLRADGRRVARRTVRAATGGTVEVRMRRPAGRLQVAATVR